jgi:hypothetical protein
MADDYTPDNIPEQQPLTQRPLNSSAPKLSLATAKFDVSYDKLRKKWTIRTTALSNDGVTTKTHIVEREKKDLDWLFDQLFLDYPGHYIPAKELLEAYTNLKDSEHLLVLVFLTKIQRHPVLANDNSLWDLLTASDQEFDRSVQASRDELLKHQKGDIYLNYKKWAPKKFRNREQESYITYLEKLQQNYRATIGASKRLQKTERDIFDSFDSIGREFKVFGNHDKANHNIFHAAGDQFMKLALIPSTPLNLIPIQQTMDFVMDVYANHIIPSIYKFIDQPVIAAAEVNAIQSEIEQTTRKLNQLSLKPNQTPNDQKIIQTYNELIEKLKKDLAAADQRKEVITKAFASELKRIQSQMRHDLASGMLTMLHDRLETQNRVIEQLTSQWAYSVLQQQ